MHTTRASPQKLRDIARCIEDERFADPDPYYPAHVVARYLRSAADAIEAAELPAMRRRARAMSRQTGAPVAECARWLEESGGDVERAVEMMRARSA